MFSHVSTARISLGNSVASMFAHTSLRKDVSGCVLQRPKGQRWGGNYPWFKHTNYQFLSELAKHDKDSWHILHLSRYINRDVKIRLLPTKNSMIYGSNTKLYIDWYKIYYFISWHGTFVKKCRMDVWWSTCLKVIRC